MKTTFYIFSFFILGIALYSCDSKSDQKVEKPLKKKEPDTLVPIAERFNYQIDTPICNDLGCTGKYTGVEFVDEEYMLKLNLTGIDIAHNYSNLMCEYVGKKLKELYREGNYSKVDLKNIRMTTKGMGDGDDYVEYSVSIPFVRVKDKAHAMTAFDHSGGWGHTPALKERKQQLLKGGIVKDGRLYVSPLKKTPEGLEEYWIQWRHVEY
jgi:hypothetical protein